MFTSGRRRFSVDPFGPVDRTVQRSGRQRGRRLDSFQQLREINPEYTDLDLWPSAAERGRKREKATIQPTDV